MGKAADMVFELLAIDNASEVFHRVGDAAESSSAKVEASGEATKSGSALGAMALAGLAAGAGFVAVKSIQMAAQFQTSMNTLVTSAGESPKALGMVGNGIKGIAVDTATSTQQLISGMYMIESAGYHGASGLSVLRSAAEGAKAENADLSTVTNALTTEMNDYHIPVDKSTQAMNALIAVTSAGKTHLEDLAEAFPTVGPVAASLHVSLAQVGGAMATMTGQGISAQNAAMELRASMLSLVNPNKVQIDEMSNMGLKAKEVAQTLTHKGLSAAFDELATAAGKHFPAGSAGYNQALARMTGTTRGLQVALALTGKNTGTMAANVKSVGTAFDSSGKQVSGFDIIQKSFNFRLGQFKEAIDVSMISLGQKLLPVVTQFVSILTKAIGPISSVMGWLVHSKPAIAALATVVSILALNAMVELTTSIWASVAALTAADVASGGILIAIGLLAAGLVYAYQHFGWFRDAVNGTFHAISATIGWLVDFIRDHWKLIISIVLGPLGIWVVLIVSYWHQIVTGISTAISWVIDFVKNHWQLLITLILGPLGVMIVLVRHYWYQIGQGLQALYSDVIKPVFGFIVTVVKTDVDIWIALFKFLWNYVWTDFGQKVYQFFMTTVPNWLRQAWQLFLNIFINPWKTQFQELWNWIWGSFGQPIYRFFTSTLPGWIRSGMSSVASAMRQFAIAMETPVNWTIQHVYDDGIKGIWNTIASIFHGPTLPSIGPLPSFATGGVVPISPMMTSGPMAIVGEGNPAWPEYVIPTDPKYRDRAATLWLNAGNGLQMLAGGGVLGGIGSFFGGIVNSLKGLFLGGLEAAARAAFSPLNSLMGKMPGSSTMIGQMLIDGIKTGENGLLGLLHHEDQLGGGPVVSAAKSQLGVPYSWGGGGPDGPSYGFAQGAGIKGFDCSALMQYAYWQGAHRLLPRTTYEQVLLGKPITSQADLAPGDLVFPYASLVHVMMVAAPGAAGPNGMIEAPHTGASVRMNSFYAMDGGARRILGYAGGGILSPGELALVGEAGPELVYAGPSGGAVQPLGMGGGHFTAEITIKWPDGQQMDKQWVQFQRRGGTSQAMQTEIKRTVVSSARTQ